MKKNITFENRRKKFWKIFLPFFQLLSTYSTNGAVSFNEYCLFAYRLRESLVYVAPQICKQTILKKMKIETHVSKEKCPKTLIFRKFYLNHTEVRLPKEFFYVEANVFFLFE